MPTHECVFGNDSNRSMTPILDTMQARDWGSSVSRQLATLLGGSMGVES